MAIIAVSGWRGLSQVQENTREIYEEFTVAGTELATVGTDLLKYRNRVIMSIGAASIEDFNEFSGELPGLQQHVNETLTRYRSKLTAPSSSGRDPQKHFKDLDEILQAYWALDRRTIEQTRQSWKAATPQDSERLRNAAKQNAFFTSGPTLDATGQGLDEVLATLKELAKDQNAEAIHTSARATATLWIVLIISGGVALVLATFIIRGVKKPLDRISYAFHHIGEGDLTKRVEQDSQDEMGMLSAEMNQFVGKLHDTIAKVAQASSVLSSKARSLSSVSATVSEGTREQANQATHAASAVEEMSATVSEMAKNAQEMTSMSDVATKAAQSGGGVVRQAITDMQLVHESVQQTAEKIALLGKGSQEISEIIKVITDIADQTNLLALNAAIEAARAGEQGRGFAVVADEVRKLAERTTRATSEISNMIASIQRETEEAVSAMKAGTARVETGVTLVNEAGQHLDNILTSANTVTTMVQRMAASIGEQSTVANQLASNVQSVATISRQNETSISEASEDSVQLFRMATELQALILQFHLKKSATHA
jgi:methyl-accepting chemotaxis protein